MKSKFDLIVDWVNKMGSPIISSDAESGLLVTLIPGDGILHSLLIQYDKESVSLSLTVEIGSIDLKSADKCFLRRVLCINSSLVLGKFGIWNKADLLLFFVNLSTAAGLNEIDFLRAVMTVRLTMKEHYLSLKEMLNDVKKNTLQDKAEELASLKVN